MNYEDIAIKETDVPVASTSHFSTPGENLCE